MPTYGITSKYVYIRNYIYIIIYIYIRRPRRRQGGARQRKHYNQPGARNDESKQQEPERGKQRNEDSKEQEHASKVAAIEKATKWDERNGP